MLVGESEADERRLGLDFPEVERTHQTPGADDADAGNNYADEAEPEETYLDDKKMFPGWKSISLVNPFFWKFGKHLLSNMKNSAFKPERKCRTWTTVQWFVMTC